MAIESTSSAPPPDKPPQSGARPAKSRAGDTEVADAGDFLALMAAMGDDVTAIAEDPLADLKLKEAVSPVDIAQDATNLKADPLLAADLLPSPVGAEAAATVMPAAVSDTPGAVQAQPQRPTVTLEAVGLSKSKEGGKPAVGAAKPTGLLQDALSPTSTLALQSLSSENAAGQDTKGQEGKFFPGLEAFKTLSKDTNAQPAATLPVAPALPQEKTLERTHAVSDVSKGASLEAPVPLGVVPTGAGPSISTLASPQMSAPLEVAVAEKVAYWIGQDVQNAELQLDGLGKDAVQVSISMVGNEAQVTFRTDETVTRDALQAASGQLKDMLSREGVFLSGVSVGQSGTGGAQDGQRQARQGHRQVGHVTASVEAAVAATRPARGTTGRNLDLFV